MTLKDDIWISREIFTDLKKVLNDDELFDLQTKLNSLRAFGDDELSYPSQCLASHIFWELEERSHID
jgi:hypothetical protein